MRPVPSSERRPAAYIYITLTRRSVLSPVPTAGVAVFNHFWPKRTTNKNNLVPGPSN